ncbi:hypothetical protein E2320_022393 [Naja naja]|nr:hypothetical protein E2320_022393 [Naja naja]
MLCFRCGKPGHWAVECLEAVTVAAVGSSASRPDTSKRTATRTPERVRSAIQACPSSPVGESEVKTRPAVDLDTSEGEGDGEADPMVSMAVQPFWILVQVMTRSSRGHAAHDSLPAAAH